MENNKYVNVDIVDLEQTDLTILPDSISYYEDYFLKPLTEDILQKNTTSNSLLNYHYPVGFIIEVSSSTYNPNGKLPGTWTRFGEGRAKISAEGDSSLLETSLGTFSHLLTIDEIPSHRHRLGYDSASRRQRQATSWTEVCESNSLNSRKVTAPTGGDLAHNNVQPYIVTFSWKRVS